MLDTRMTGSACGTSDPKATTACGTSDPAPACGTADPKE